MSQQKTNIVKQLTTDVEASKNTTNTTTKTTKQTENTTKNISLTSNDKLNKPLLEDNLGTLYQSSAVKETISDTDSDTFDPNDDPYYDPPNTLLDKNQKTAAIIYLFFLALCS